MPFGDVHWQLLVELSEIIDILYTDDIDHSVCSDLEKRIKSHHTHFKHLYPSVNLKKKHHNMVHYPSAIRKIGCLANYCTLRFEGKHVFFKTAQKVSHNFKNIPLTLAKKHQINFAFNLMNSNLLNKVYVVLKGDEMGVRELDGLLKLKLMDICKVMETDQIIIAESIQHYGVIYKKDAVVLKTKLIDNLIFCCISNIIVYEVKN